MNALACQCTVAAAVAKSTGQQCVCDLCGSVLSVVPQPERSKRQRSLARMVTSPNDPQRTVRIFVRDLLTWTAAVARIDRQAHGSQSPTEGVLMTLRTGIVGTGCYGTKGIGHAPAYELDRRELAVDPAVAERYQALCGEDKRTADAVCDDGQGDQIVSMAFGDRTLDLDLAARIGWRLADPKQAERWEAKILARDSRAALAGAEDLGSKRLIAASKNWVERP